jgi:HAD superfamily hydrolase (TIGR01458 family)
MKKDFQKTILKPVKGLLIDIDGVLYVEKQPIRGAVEAIEYLQTNHIPFMLATNTTRRSRYSLLTNLQQLGFRLHVEQIFSAPYAAALWLKERKVRSISLFLRGDTYREFRDFHVTTNKPEYLVIGDIAEDLTYGYLNQAFRMVMSGTKMLALQKNRYWQTNAGLAIDTGAVVAALEYATRKRATVIGKPNAAFFNHGIKKLDLPAENVAIIGDDLESDIAGGEKAGMCTIAVRTGKFREDNLRRRKIHPDYILDSINSLPEWLESQM